LPERTQLRDRYELKEVLGRGGMGVVYRAWDTLMKREVALKTVLEVDNPLSLDLFFREWGVLAAMVHPNIISIYDIGEFEQEGTKRPFFVMPLLPGVSLDRLIREGSPRLTVPRLMDIIGQASRGLQAAHDLGLVHRDVKPSNIFVLDDDSVKLIDFGIARLTTTSSKTSLKGTLSYIAPEQLQMKPPTPLSDQYSLAVVCYEALTRRLPFRGATDTETIEAILHQTAPPVSELSASVSYPVSQVIHKAMAKNPWNRFPSAKEFGDTLQRALRGEPIEYFDISKIRPRLQRAKESFEQGDYEFASEILAELESEGHIEQEIVLVRRQVEQTVRRKRIGVLLESARRFHQAQEYSLALRKIQEALDLDANDPDVLVFKGVIEKERRSRKIDEWIQIARQHIGNKAFPQAQEALDKALKLKPDDTEALRLMAELRRREQELARTREQKAHLYRQAMEAWQRGEVTGALSKLDVLAALERETPDADTSFASAFQSFYNQVRSEHDSLKNQYAEARRLLAEDNFEAAMAISRQVLAQYPNHALFQALEYDIKERQSQKLSAAIAATDRRLEEEPDLDRRVAILEEVLKVYPGEKHFEQALRLVRDKRDLIQSIVIKAQFYEERQQFNEALDQWQIIRSIHERYPGLSFELERLAKKRDQQARESAKAQWVGQIDRLLESGDYGRAREAAASALGEFPADAELGELEKLVQKSQERADQAMGLLGRARESIDAGRFGEGIGILREAWKLDSRNSVVKAVLANTLLEEATRLVETDWSAAEGLLKELQALELSYPGALSLANQVADRRREEFLSWCLAQARRLQTDGDLEGALAVVRQGLQTYPKEPRLHQVRAALERAIGETQQPAASKQPVPAAATDPQQLASGPATVPCGPFTTSEERETEPLIPLTRAEGEEAEAKLPERRHPPERGKPAPLPAAVRHRHVAPQFAGRTWIYAVALAFAGVWLVITLVRLAGIRVGSPPAIVLPGARQVTISALPEGAEIRIDDDHCGVSRCEVSLSPGVHRVVAALPGYEAASTTIYVPEIGSEALEPVHLRLVPVSPVLMVSTNLEGAELSLDGAPGFKMPGPEMSLPLAEGRHTVRLSGGVSEAVFTFEISRSTAPTLSLPLRARAVSATLVAVYGSSARVYTTEAGASVAVDGRSAGEVPVEGLHLTDLGAGSREVVLTSPSGDTRRLVFDAGSSPALVISASASLALGGLRLVTGEDDVKVYLNGEPYRRLTQRGRLLIFLPPKQYSVRVEKEGFVTPPEQMAEVLRGQEVRLDFQLVPAPAPASLTVWGGVAESEVLVDRRRVGLVQPDGNLTVPGIEPGKRTVTIRKHGYKPLEAEYVFVPGKRLEVAGVLVAVLGQLRIEVTPANVPVRLELRREGEATVQPIAQAPLELPEGMYTVIATAAGYQAYESTVKVVPNQSATASIRLEPLGSPVPAKTSVRPFALADWEKAGGWQREGKTLARLGGENILMPESAVAGAIQFRVVLPGRKRLEWVVGFRDEQNYILYRLERNTLERTPFVQGKRGKTVKADHPLRLDRPVDVSIALTGMSIRTSVLTGQDWMVVDEFTPGDGEMSGRFGFRIPGRERLVLEEFSYTPR
jgi:tetratricopeptide (TPR) repeat protein